MGRARPRCRVCSANFPLTVGRRPWSAWIQSQMDPIGSTPQERRRPIYVSYEFAQRRNYSQCARSGECCHRCEIIPTPHDQIRRGCPARSRYPNRNAGGDHFIRPNGSDHLIARARSTQLPWVAHFSDPWVEPRMQRPGSDRLMPRSQRRPGRTLVLLPRNRERMKKYPTRGVRRSRSFHTA